MDTTVQDAFYTALEQDPQDWLSYAVYADWLDENGLTDLAEGFRAMAAYRRSPLRDRRRVTEDTYEDPEPWKWQWYAEQPFYDYRTMSHAIPDCWSKQVGRGHRKKALRESLEVVALAYSRLTEAEKRKVHEVLVAEVEVST